MAERRGSWYDYQQQAQHPASAMMDGHPDGRGHAAVQGPGQGQGQPGQYIGIDISNGSSGVGSAGSQGPAGWNNGHYSGQASGSTPRSLQAQQQQQQSAYYQTALSPSSPAYYNTAGHGGNTAGQSASQGQGHGQGQAAPPLHKRPSTSHLQAIHTTSSTNMAPGGAGLQASALSPGIAMSLSPAMRSAPPSATHSNSSTAMISPYSPHGPGAGNPGLGFPRGVVPNHTGGSAASPTPASRAGQGSSNMLQHPSHAFNRSNSSGSALSVSTSPTTTGGQGSPMTPSSPAYAVSTTSPAFNSHQQQQQQHLNNSYQGNQGTNSAYASMDASPMLGASANQGQNQDRNASPAFRTPAPPASTVNNSYSSTASNASTSTATARPALQATPSHASSASQYSNYLEDPASSMTDRRPGSYSPSHYAIAAGGGMHHQQVRTQNSPYSAGPSQLQSPRQPPPPSSSSTSASSNANSYFAHPGHANTSAQLSPIFSRHQQQPSLSHSQSNSSATSPTYHTPSAHTLGQYQTRHQHSRSISSSHSQGAPASAGYQNPAAQYHQPAHQRQRPRSKGSAFRRIASTGDLRPLEPEFQGRRADPEGGSVSPIKALTTQLSQTYHLVNPGFRYEFSLNPRRVLTKPSKPAGNDGYDNEDSDYILYVNDVLGSESNNKYLILDVLGQGTFGQVVKCQNMKTHEIVGVKVIKNKPAYYQQSMMEITILEMLNMNYDPEDKHHILRLKDTFVHCRHLCLVFELLSSNLYELIKQNAFRGLSTSLVRVFTEQLLDALSVLKDARLIHCDLKPENILLKTLQSPDIKVIDFGSACHEKQTVYTYIQSRFYRSPEVLLGLPYSTTIDMWSLGCICVELFLGLPLFPGTSEFNQVTRIVEMLGLPPTYMLEQGKQVSHFFNVIYDEYGRKTWRLKTLEEYEREHPQAKEQPSKKFFAANTLPEIIKTYPNQRKNQSKTDLDREVQNRVALIDFVSGLLNMNPLERWTPEQARQHPFVLNEVLRAPYVPKLGPASSSRNHKAQQSQATQTSAANSERPYGGLPPTPARASTRTYQDAAAYQQHLNQQQVHAAQASANAYRQTHFSQNPYAQQDQSPKQALALAQQQQQGQAQYVASRLPATTSAPTLLNQQQQQQQQQQQRVQQPPSIIHHGPSSSMSAMPYSSSSNAMRNSASGPLSPTIPTNPPAAHHYPIRGRSGTFSQMDVPPALQKLGLDLSSYKAIGTPQLRREDQRAAWERRHGGSGGTDTSALDRRRSLRQANPHLEHLEYYAQSGQPGYYYASPQTLQQPFSVVVDPRMQQDSGVTIPPQVYAGAPGTRYAAPPQALPLHTAPPPGASTGAMPYDAFDQYDSRDGINAMLHQPLVPTQQSQQRGGAAGPPMAYYGNPGPGQAGIYGQGLPYPAQSSAMKNADDFMNGMLTHESGGSTSSGGKQRKSDSHMWP